MCIRDRSRIDARLVVAQATPQIGVGPGRGSAAGAIVAYAMGITDLDPMPNEMCIRDRGDPGPYLERAGRAR